MSEFADSVRELMAPIGPVRVRAMFGGHGVFLDGLMFALIADDELYFKIDAESVERFREAGCEPFVFESRGRKVEMSYYSAPPEVFEDAEAAQQWAERALDAALRGRR